MPIYAKPARALMEEWAREHLHPGQSFRKSEAVEWFKSHYPEIKSNTVEMHVESMAVNNPIRRHYPTIRAGSGHDLFWKIGPKSFRLWDEATDPPPRYKAEIEAEIQAERGGSALLEIDDEEAEPSSSGDGTFAYEKDLQNYLVRNLHVLEGGLKLYEEDGFDGVEYNAGGRFIDILAVDRNGAFVIIELKVSRGYDRVIGQLLRYMGWVEQNMSNGNRVRGIIVANEITSDLILATRHLPNVQLFQYGISFSVTPMQKLHETLAPSTAT